MVCVWPLFNNYSLVKNLLEFIAYYRVNGADRFVFYVESATDQVLQLLSSMSTFVDLYPWILKNGWKKDASYKDQITATDDCLYRHRRSVVILVDVDEFMVPFNHPTLKSLIFDEYRDSAVLSVNNVFFCCQFNGENLKDFPRILNQFNRDFLVLPRKVRSK